MASHDKVDKGKPRQRKSKGLPNLHRPEGVVIIFPEALDEYGHRPEPPSLEQLDQLARKHGFRVPFDAAGDLELLWYWWRGRLQVRPEPSGTERGQVLQAVARRAGGLADALRHAGANEQELINGAFPSWQLDCETLLRIALRLEVASKTAAEMVAASKPGQQGDPVTIALLSRLWRIFRKAFGAAAPRISRSDKYGGAFFEFADDVMRVFGVGKSNNALGKAIEKALRAVDRQDAEAKVSPN
jgi:hypothetical protein